MNAVVFYILAALVVVASATVVVAPRMRDASGAMIAAALLIAILSGVAGARIVAVAQFVVPVLCVGAVLWLARRRGYLRLMPPSALTPRIPWAGAAVAAGVGALLITVFAASGGGWHAGSGTAGLITVLHYRAPDALVIAAILAGAGVATSLLVGRTGADERETDEALAARRRREERTRRRREDRESARRRRGGVPPAEAGA